MENSIVRVSGLMLLVLLIAGCAMLNPFAGGYGTAGLPAQPAPQPLNDEEFKALEDKALALVKTGNQVNLLEVKQVTQDKESFRLVLPVEKNHLYSLSVAGSRYLSTIQVVVAFQQQGNGLYANNQFQSLLLQQYFAPAEGVLSFGADNKGKVVIAVTGIYADYNFQSQEKQFALAIASKKESGAETSQRVARELAYIEQAQAAAAQHEADAKARADAASAAPAPSTTPSTPTSNQSGSAKKETGPKSVSIYLNNQCSDSVKIFFGDKPKYGSGKYVRFSGNTTTSYRLDVGSMIWIVDESDNGLDSYTITASTSRVIIDSSGKKFKK